MPRQQNATSSNTKPWSHIKKWILIQGNTCCLISQTNVYMCVCLFVFYVIYMHINWVCMHLCLLKHDVCTCMLLYICVFVHVWLNTWMYVCVYGYYICLYLFYVYLYVCISSLYACTHICMYACMHTYAGQKHVYTHMSLFPNSWQETISTQPLNSSPDSLTRGSFLETSPPFGCQLLLPTPSSSSPPPSPPPLLFPNSI